MSLFFGAKGPIVPPDFTGLQVSTSSALMPIPICYGSPLVATNLIEATNFFSKKASAKKSGAGKGGSNTTIYFVDAILSLGELPATEWPGPVPALRVNGSFSPVGAPLNGTYTTLYFMGPNDGPPFGFASLDLRPYPGLVLYQIGQLTAGSNASIPQIEVMTLRKFYGTCPLNVVAGLNILQDADPALCMIDILTHPRYGAGFPPGLLFGAATGDLNNGLSGSFLSGPNATVVGTGDAAFSTYCQAIGFGFSACIRGAEPAAQIVDRWAKLMSLAIVWTGTTFKVIPYWDVYASTNPGLWIDGGYVPKFFNPPTTPLYDLGDDDIIQTKEKDDPITIQRMSPADVYNRVRVSFKDRLNEFSTNLVEAMDENSINTGDALVTPFNRVMDIQAGDEFTFSQYAQSAAQVILNRNMAIRDRGRMTLGWDKVVLEPLDPVTITDANLSLNRFPIRVVSITERDDFMLDVEFEEFPIGAAAPAIYQTQASSGPSFSNNAVPKPVFAPLFAEPGPQLVPVPTLVIALSGGLAGAFDANWGGCQIWMSSDGGTTYTQIGTLNGASKLGALTASLAAFSGLNPDSGNTLSVSMALSEALLASATHGNAMAGIPYCVIKDAGGGQEFLSFQTATLTGANAYNLTTLYRGFGASNSGCAHASGAQFAVLDSGVFSWPVSDVLLGTQLWFKFPSFNAFGLQQQPLSGATAYAYTPGTLYVEDVCTGTAHAVPAQPSFVGAHINWLSPTTAAKSETIPGAVNCDAGFVLSLADAEGTAGDFPIAVLPASGTISGNTADSLSSPYDARRYRADPANNNWIRIG